MKNIRRNQQYQQRVEFVQTSPGLHGRALIF